MMSEMGNLELPKARQCGRATLRIFVLIKSWFVHISNTGGETVHLHYPGSQPIILKGPGNSE